MARMESAKPSRVAVGWTGKEHHVNVIPRSGHRTRTVSGALRSGDHKDAFMISVGAML